MPAFSATAPGKIILFGEHAVVYGRPAIAGPVAQARTRVTVIANPKAKPAEARLQSPLVGLDAPISQLPAGQPLARTIELLLETLKIPYLPACTIRITSTIAVACGMGSGAAVTVAMLRALSAFLGCPLPDEIVSSLAFEVEKIYHGIPSGIDNTVIAYRRPVYFIKGQPIQFLKLPKSFTLVIADSGIPSPTAVTVGEVRRGWQAEPARYEAIFDQIGRITQQAREFIEKGKSERLGALMNENHILLQELGVSSPDLDRLVLTAQQNGALGAKLSGGGRGGNLIALTEKEQARQLAKVLTGAGAARVIVSEVGNGR